MYYPQGQKEPSGCLQTIVITRVIFGILLVPVAFISLALFFVVFTFYLFTANPPLALIPLFGGGLLVWGLAKWERARIAKENPPDNDR